MSAEHVSIMEVGPRDGLQNEATLVETDAKIEMVEGLVNAGLSRVEITSFVNPRWIPPLADQREVAVGIQRRESVVYAALVPNMKGYENARAAGMTEVALVLSASETHNKKNINSTVEETLQRYVELTERARSENVVFRAYVSTAFGCPYEGRQDPARVAELAARLLSMGAYQVSLGDTIGVGTPRDVTTLCKEVARVMPLSKVALHLHDTRGTALANTLRGLEEGVRAFDSSVGGLGGCPYAPGASGNLATEDLVFMLEGMGFQTGVDLDKLTEVSRTMGRLLGRVLPSKYAQAGAWKPRLAQ
jgi:hydroxymethylglutaryl-CoA lyase